MTARCPLALAPIALIVLSSCASMDPNVVRRRSCHHGGAFEDGMNDGRGGAAMSSRHLEVCDPAVLEEARRGYREGYLTGLAARAEAQRAAAALAESQRAAAIGPGAPHGPEQRAFVCEVSTSGSTFASFGPTEDEAGADAKARCLGFHSEASCWPVRCRRNR